MTELTGVVTQVIGPVVDISFEKSDSELPKIHDALEISKDKDEKLIVECQQHTSLWYRCANAGNDGSNSPEQPFH